MYNFLDEQSMLSTRRTNKRLLAVAVIVLIVGIAVVAFIVAHPVT
jgi:hypothetical protein